MDSSVVFTIVAAALGLLIGGAVKGGFSLANLRRVLGLREKEEDLVALEESIDEVEREQKHIHRNTQEKIDEIEKRRKEKKKSLKTADDRELVERLSRALERTRRSREQ
jgi:DNA-binding transcriptional MerR regulator